MTILGLRRVISAVSGNDGEWLKLQKYPLPGCFDHRACCSISDKIILLLWEIANDATGLRATMKYLRFFVLTNVFSWFSLHNIFEANESRKAPNKDDKNENLRNKCAAIGERNGKSQKLRRQNENKTTATGGSRLIRTNNTTGIFGATSGSRLIRTNNTKWNSL